MNHHNTPNSTRPSTLPSKCARTITNTSKQQPQQLPNRASTGHVPEHPAVTRCHQHLNRTVPPSSQPSIWQNSSPSSLDFRTPMVFSYLGNDRPCGQRHDPKQHLHHHPKLHAPWHPAGNLGKNRPQQTAPQNRSCISTLNCMRPSVWQKSACTIASTSNSTCTSTTNCPLAPAVHQRLKQHRHQTAAQQTACPLAPGRHLHQHPKLRAP